jgi:hypothetical protein
MHNLDAFHCPRVTEEVDKSMLLLNNAKAFLGNVIPSLSERFAHCSMQPERKHVTKSHPGSWFVQFRVQFHHIYHKGSEMGADKGADCTILLARKLGDQITGCVQESAQASASGAGQENRGLPPEALNNHVDLSGNESQSDPFE